MSVSKSPAWQKLLAHRDFVRGLSATALFADPARLSSLDIHLDGLRLNYAFQNVTPETMAMLGDLARQQNLEDWRRRMFAGEKINGTEKRAVLHTALRRASDEPLPVDGADVMPAIREAQRRMASFVTKVRSGEWKGATGQAIRYVVNIGIGGSDLGPRLAAQALDAFVDGIDLRFVANADAFDLNQALRGLDPAQTLFVIVSKTFTTQETLLNARSARRWLTSALGEDAVAKHFVAVSVNKAEVEKFGIYADTMFPMWDWVGGRFSVWSAVGLSVALAVGNEIYADFLAGAAAMDAHFLYAPLDKNLPVVLGLLAVWNRNFLGSPALAVLPYCERLREFPRYLQQLEMESNGKSVTRDGAPVDYETAPVIFGDCGTVSQHSFHQCLHQGSTTIAADFIAAAQDDLNQPGHHRALLSNMAAQIGALAFGQSDAAPHEIYSGRKGSNLILLDRLDARRLGMLLALYEHKTFVQGTIWDINSFDQPGVELGKRMANNLEKGATAGASAAAMVALYAKMAT
jgi:glucose-6-phosphate isomerase